MKSVHRSDRECTQAARVLVVDDHASARESVVCTLAEAGHEVESVASAAEALQALEKATYDVVLTDLNMPGMTGLDLLRHMQNCPHGAQVIMITAYGTVSSAVEAMRHGAFDYIEKPFEADHLEHLVARAIRQGRLIDQNPRLPNAAGGPVMIGSGTAMREFRARLAQFAPTAETVLITGESGTGKELAARALHAASSRADHPLVSLNCPILSAQLLESELFGHERGAFTGAESPRTGRFELADGGTILLDEITEIDVGLQAKLLRVLQEKCFERVGSSLTRQVDVRVLATTNRDLREVVQQGEFREDLYYRLAVLHLVVPPLRERREDIPELVDYFREQAAARVHGEPCTLDAGARDLLIHYAWPGNVRELQNVITRATVLNGGGPVTAEDLGPWLIGEEVPAVGRDASLPVGISLQEMERKLIEATLESFDGHRAKTAKALGIGIRTLSGKLRLYGHPPRGKSVAKAA